MEYTKIINYCDFNMDSFSSMIRGELLGIKIQTENAIFPAVKLPTLKKSLYFVEWKSRDTIVIGIAPEMSFSGVVKMRLGCLSRLLFQDFQIHFNIERDCIVRLLENGGSIGFLLNEIIKNIEAPMTEQETKTIDDLCKEFPSVITKNIPSGPRYITEDFSLENFLFSKESIHKYFTACHSDTLDFCLTYRIHDILSAIHSNNLKRHLETCPEIKIIDERFPKLFSLLYPSYLLDYDILCRDFKKTFSRDENYGKLPGEKEWIDHIQKAISSNADYRTSINLDDCWNALCILFNRQTEKLSLSRVYTDKDKIKKNAENCKNLFKEIEKTPEKLEPTNIAKAYSKQQVALHKDCWDDEDAIRYAYEGVDAEEFSNFNSSVKRDDFVSVIKALHKYDLRNSTIYRFDKFNSILIGDLRTLCEGISFDKKDYNTSSISYFLYSTVWNDGHLIDRWTCGKEEKLENYQKFLELFTYLRIAGVRYSLFQTVKFFLQKIESFIEERECSLFTNFFSESSILEKEDIIKKITHFKIPYSQILPMLPSFSFSVIQQFKIEQEIRTKDAAEAKAHECELEKKNAEAQAEIQKEVFRSMNHSIKNLVSSVTAPLDLVKKEINPQLIIPNKLIREAIQGASLISEITSAISLSYRSNSNIDWKKDLIPANGGTKLQDIIHSALFYSVPHMFINNLTLYMNESKQYFPSNEVLRHAETEWYQSGIRSQKLQWIERNLFHLSVDIPDNLAKKEFGNQYSTTINLFVLLNEIFLNAIKGTAYLEASKRLVQIQISLEGASLVFDIQNTTESSHAQAPKSGFGHLIIENFLQMFGCHDTKFAFDEESHRYTQHFSLPLTQE